MFDVDPAQRQTFHNFFQQTVKSFQHLTSPEIQRILNNEFCRLVKVDDLFAKEKAQSNAIALALYDEWKPKVLASNNPFDLALRLSIAGNIMDYGANNSFDLQQTVQKVLQATFAIDHSKLLYNKIKKAQNILYLGDNAGEIVFDKLFIETCLTNKQIYFAVKDVPTLNDVTIKEAKEVGIDKLTTVISNGFDAPSTVLSKCSKEFLEIYHSADLIISKGQGNYEGLMDEKDPRIFFLLMAKCDVIAEKLNVEKGSFIVYHQNE
jgi:hypothetical protein